MFFEFQEFFEASECELNLTDDSNDHKNDLLNAVLHSIGAQVFNSKCVVTQTKLFFVPTDEFVHGWCVMNGQLAVILFCPDIEMGMVAISMASSNDRVHYVRFTATSIEGCDMASINLSASRTLH